MSKNSPLQLNLFESVEHQVKPANGNQQLVGYGIQNDGSDYRVHVGYKTQHIYVFPTAEARKALEREARNLQLKKGGQPGVNFTTFTGYPVPISSIDGMQIVLIPHDIYQKNVIQKTGMTTSMKGVLAVNIVVSMLKRQLIMLPLQVSIVTSADLQIKGGDIIIKSSLTLQVKCDYAAGDRARGGTGNVFLQTAECNPRKYT